MPASRWLLVLVLGAQGCFLFDEEASAPVARECADLEECDVAQLCVEGRCVAVDAHAGVPTSSVIEGDRCADARACVGDPVPPTMDAFEDGAGLPPGDVCGLDRRCEIGACNAKLVCAPAGPGRTPGGVACLDDDACTSGFCARRAAPLDAYPNDVVLEPGGPGVCLRVCDGVNDCPGTRGIDRDAGSICRPAIAGGRRLSACLPAATTPAETSCQRDAECLAASALDPTDPGERRCRFHTVTKFRWGIHARIPVPVCRPAHEADAQPVGALCRTDAELRYEACCSEQPPEDCEDPALRYASQACAGPLDEVLASCAGGWCASAHLTDKVLQEQNNRWFDTGSGDPAAIRCGAPCGTGSDCPDRWQCMSAPRMEDLGEWGPKGTLGDPEEQRGLQNRRCMLPIGACFDEFDCRSGLPTTDPPQRPDARGSWDLDGRAERCTFDLRSARAMTVCLPATEGLAMPGQPCDADAACDTNLCLPVDPLAPDGPQSCATPCDPISAAEPDRDRCGLLAPGVRVERPDLAPYLGLAGFEGTAGTTCRVVPLVRPGLVSTSVHVCR